MLITTIDKFVAIVPTAAGVKEFSDLQPYCQSAEIWLKTNILGKTLYEAISDSLESSTGAGSDETLVRLCRNVVCNHAYWDAIPFLDVVHSGSGFAVIQNNNLVPASKERVERLREQCLIRRDAEVENLIDYLEDNETYHDRWKGSPAYSILSDCLIQTARELALYAEWEGNRKDFLKLRPKMIQETMLKLEPVFSKDYIEELVEKQRDDDVTGDDLKVIVLLKYALGSLVSGNQPAAEKIAADALRYIDANLESFATYTESDEYIARTTAGYVNETDLPIFFSNLF